MRAGEVLVRGKGRVCQRLPLLPEVGVLKQQALAHAAPSGIAPGQYEPGDALLAFLEAL